tara:strand:+ start:4569 stop:6215 length:1647 start_codon:yes stop_codon:yes gene_type:complete
MSYVSKKLLNYSHYLFFIFFFIIGICLYKDFGFNIDESFQRKSGLYWLKYISDFFQFNDFSLAVKQKLNLADDFTIPWFGDYGIIFDLPAALFEIMLDIKEPLKVYELRHLLNFFYFFFGVIFLYKLLSKRFSKKILPLLGILLFVLTPRLFGDSFHNNKDIIFLTFFIISIYYYFENFNKNSLKNILLLSLFSAIATSTRIFGIIIPFGILLLYFLSILSNKKEIKNLKFIIYFFIFYFLFLILHWPFLWENTLTNIYDFLTHYKVSFGPPLVFFNGEFYKPNLVPQYYLLLWIFISTPVLNLMLFTSGFFILLKRVFYKFDFINENRNNYDFWKNSNEKKDFFLLIIFLILILIGSFFDIKYYNSWRFFYFLNFFIIYFSLIFLEYYLEKIKLKKIFNYFYVSLFFILVFLNVYKVIIYHPYQSLYFNSLIPNKMKNNFEVDFMGLSSIEFLRNLDKNYKGEVKLGVKSWYPIWRTHSLLNEKAKSKIKLVFEDEILSADILYSNRIYDVNIFKSNKYNFEGKFTKTKELVIDNLIIYEIFEKKLK